MLKYKIINIKNKLLKFILLKIIFPIYYKLLTFHKPIIKNKVICDTRNNDVDKNSLNYLIQKLNNNSNFSCTIINNEEYYKFSNIKYIKDISNSNFIIISTLNSIIDNLPIRKETKVINVWHGCGIFKKFGFSTFNTKWGNGNRALSNKIYNHHKRIDIFTVSSPYVIPFYCEALNHTENENIIKSIGIPRTDIFFEKTFFENSKKNLEKTLDTKISKKIILYAPTFRGNSIEKANIPEFLDLESFNNSFGKEYILIIKHHPATKNSQLIPEHLKNNIFDLTKNANINELLVCTDILISDYSSLIFEFSLLNRPMLFFAPDLEKYNDDRGFYINYFSMMQNLICRNNAELFESIKNINKYDYDKIKLIKDKFMSSCDGHATERLIKLMDEMK